VFVRDASAVDVVKSRSLAPLRIGLVIKVPCTASLAQVSSSSSKHPAPTSRASTIAAAWEVLPLASSVQKNLVSRAYGRLLINGVMSTPSTRRPSSARTCSTHHRTVTAVAHAPR